MRKSLLAKFAFAISCGVSLLLSSLVLQLEVQAQCNGKICQGDNAVFSSGSPQQSHSFIDASEITSANGDVCVAINSALLQILQNSGYYGNIGAVIDARGFSAPTISCIENPWTGLSSGSAPSATILLPTGIIQTDQTWVVPAFTRVVGQGGCIPSSSGSSCQTLTVIQASSKMPHNSPLIMMGNDTGGGACPPGKGCQKDPYNCNAVGIEHLVLDGGSSLQGMSGILNDYSQELSYVSDVSMINLGGTGLTVGIGFNGNQQDGDGDNSGPYSNLYISTTGQCVQFAGKTVQGKTYTLNQTRGIHGLTCVTTATSGSAISIDYSLNNTLEDVSITGGGTGDGIGIGLNSGLATGNVLMNIYGASLTDVVHISGTKSAPSSNTCLGGYYACDITLAGISRDGETSYTIIDGLLLPPNGFNLMDQTVGLYIVGEPVGTAGNAMSHFTTSNSIPNWLVGTSVPKNAACTVGDLFSDIDATSGTYSLYACITASGPWKAVPNSN